MKYVIPILLAICCSLSIGSETPLQGLWLVEDRPVWVEIRTTESGLLQGVVQRNDDKPQAVGRIILKNIAPESDKSWSAQVWAEKLGEFKDASLTFGKEGALEIKVKVGFLSRTVRWLPQSPESPESE